MEREVEIEIGDVLSRIPKIEKARIVEVYSRSITEDRLSVDLPPEIHGEWVLNVDVEINRKKSLGFIVDEFYATKNSLHSDGTGKPIIGDVIHMITTTENKELIAAEAKRRYLENHGRTRKQKEEKDFLTNSDGTEIKGQLLSKAEAVTGRDIIDALPQT